MNVSPVVTSIVQARGGGSRRMPPPICNGIQRYRESQSVRGLQMSARKSTVVVFEPTTLSSIVD